MADPMRIRANVDASGVTEVKVLMNHEMETGQRKDASGKTIPAWFIQNVTATHGGRTVLSAQWGPPRRGAAAPGWRRAAARRGRSTRGSAA